MSKAKNIEQRIVEMVFENDKFNKGIDDSSKKLDEFDKALKHSGKSGTSLDDLGGIASSVARKFTALETIAVGALLKIGSQAVSTGEKLVSSLTIDPIIEGYQDYQRKLNSLNTVLNNLTDNDAGKTLADVEEYFGQLDTYADDTIYVLDDMTSALAKFTNAGVDLDKSVPAIQGIANSVALAGQDANAASIAMYNLSQSIAGGFLTTIDYKSLNLANVATRSWKIEMAEAAVAAGTLTSSVNEAGETMYTVANTGHSYTVSGLFAEALSDQWATTEVMLDVYTKYADETTELGKKASAAAKEVKDYKMLMETLSASVGTGWTDTFQILIGNLTEAKVMWTAVAEELGAIFNASADSRNEMLQGWKDLGGRTELLSGIAQAYENISAILSAISEGFREIFPKTTSEQLYEITEAFHELMVTLTPSKIQLDGIKSFTKGIFTVIKSGIDIIKTLITVTGKLINLVLGNDFLDTTGGILQAIGDFLQTLKFSDDSLNNIVDSFDTSFNKIHDLFSSDKESGGESIFSKIAKAFTNFITAMKPIGTFLKNIFSPVIDALKQFVEDPNWDSVFTFVKSLVTVIAGLGLGRLFNSGADITEGIGNILEGVKNSLNSFALDLKADALLQAAKAIGVLALAMVLLSGIDSEDLLLLETVVASLGAVLAALYLVIDKFKGKELNQVAGTLDRFGTKVGNGFKNFLTLAGVGTALIGVAAAVGVFSLSILVLSKLKPEQIAQGLIAIAVGLGLMVGAVKLMSGEDTTNLMSMAFALLMLAAPIALFGKMNVDQITQGLLTLAIGLTELVLAVKIMKGTDSAKLMSITAAMIALSIPILIFSQMDIVKLAQGLGGLGVGIAEIVLAVKIMNGKDAGKLLSLAAAMVALTIPISKFGKMEFGELVVGLVGLAGALGEIILAVKIMTAEDTTNLSSLAAAMIGLAVPVYLFGTMDLSKLAQGLVGLGIGLLEVVAVSKIMTSAESVKLGAIAVAIGAIGLSVALLSNLSWDEIGKGLVGLVVPLITLAGVATVVQGAVPALIAIGVSMLLVAGSLYIASLSFGAFVETLEKLVLLSNSVKGSKMDGLKEILEVVQLLAGATVLSGLAGIFGDNSVEKFGPQLVLFAGYMKEYAKAIGSNFPAKAVTASALAGQALAELANNIPKSGGLVSLFAGENDIDDFGVKLVSFGTSMKKYSDVIGDDFNSAAVKASALAGQCLTELANTVPNSGGIVSWFTGNNDLDKFGEQIIIFGEAMKGYSDVIGSGFNSAAVKASAMAGGALVELANTIPNSGGIVSWFTGDNDIGTFGENLITFGTALVSYATAVETFPETAVKTTKNVASTLKAINSIEFDTKTVKNVSKASDELINIGNNLISYNDAIKGLSTSEMDGMTSSLKKLINVLDSANTTVNESSETLSNTITTMVDDTMKALSTEVDISADLIDVDQFYVIGINIATGMANGIREGQIQVVNAAVAMAYAAKIAAMQKLGEESPSKVFKEIGLNTGYGMANGMIDSTKTVTDSAEGMADASILSMCSAMDRINDVLESDQSMRPTITPIIDMKSVKMEPLSSYFNLDAANTVVKSTAYVQEKAETKEIIYHKFDTLRVEGVNSKGELVATANYAVEDYIASSMRRLSRR